jgi:deazaflavin-dependent oxidoreductase (nitroreductase family)
LLVHLGRRTGERHETVLEVMEYRENGPELIVMSAFGRKADWLRNIEAMRYAETTVGSRHFMAAHRILDSDEAVRVVRCYEQRNRFAAPIIRIVLSRLLGWSYHGLDPERRRLVAQLPLVGLYPRPPEEHPISGACDSS